MPNTTEQSAPNWKLPRFQNPAKFNECYRIFSDYPTLVPHIVKEYGKDIYKASKLIYTLFDIDIEIGVLHKTKESDLPQLIADTYAQESANSRLAKKPTPISRLAEKYNEHQL